METYTYKQVGPHEIRLDVHRLAAGSSLPVVLWLHGGGLIFGSRSDLVGPWAEQLRRYLALGCAVVAIDHRLAPETKLDGIVEDVLDAHRFVRERGPRLFGADAERIALVGHSAGGYLALTAGSLLRPRPAALVSFYGYGDITRPWYTEPSSHYCRMPAVSREVALAANERFPFYLHCRQRGSWPREVTGHDPHREPEWFDRFCPIRNVERGYPPTLLLHGDRDSDVPCDESVRMAERLAAHGVPHELLVIPGGEHVFDLAQHDDPAVAAALDRVTSFLRDPLGPSGPRENSAGAAREA